MRFIVILGLLLSACGDDTGTPVGPGGSGGTSGQGGMSGGGGTGGTGGTGATGGSGGSAGTGGMSGAGGSGGGTGGSGGISMDGGGIQCGADGTCPSGMRCCPCTGMCYSQGCLACCMFCRADGGTQHDCTSGICNRCQNGICCGPQNCCRRGEWCDMTNPQNPTCRCGDTGTSCTGQQTCCSGLPGPGGGACGSLCGEICPL